MTKLTDDLWRYVQVRPKENYACSEMPSKRDDQLGARIDTLRSILAGGPRGLGGPPDLKWAWENRRRCAICVSGMQRLEYRTHIATSILVGAFGVVALVGSVITSPVRRIACTEGPARPRVTMRKPRMAAHGMR